MSAIPELPSLPQDRDAERAVLGSLLRNQESVDEVAEIIRHDDFHVFAHGLIFAGIRDLCAKGRGVDLVTLANYLNDRPVDAANKQFAAASKASAMREGSQLEEIGGAAYLLDLWNSSPIVANVQAYAGIVQAKSLLRALVHAGTQIADEAMRQFDTPEAILGRLETVVQNAYGRRMQNALVSASAAVDETLEILDRRRAAAGEITDGVPYGFRDLDRMTGGMRNQELVIVAARPSVGKSLFAGEVIRNACVAGKAALMVSLEQSRTELVQRFFCAEGHLSSSAMRTAEFTPAEEQTLFMAVDGIRKWRLNFADKPQQTVFEIGANAKRMQRRSGLDLVVIDYLGLMDFEYVRGQSKANEIAAATKALKQLARDLKVPVVVLCQLSRDPAKAGERPRLHHLRDSGAIEQDADTVVMLHREGDPIQSVETAILDVYVEKQRNGPLGNVKLAHFKKNFRLADLDQFQHGMHDDFQRN